MKYSICGQILDFVTLSPITWMTLVETTWTLGSSKILWHKPCLTDRMRLLHRLLLIQVCVTAKHIPWLMATVANLGITGEAIKPAETFTWSPQLKLHTYWVPLFTGLNSDNNSCPVC